MSFEEKFDALKDVLVHSIRVLEGKVRELAEENSKLTAKDERQTVKISNLKAEINRLNGGDNRYGPYYCCCCKDKQNGERTSFTPCTHVVCGLCIRKVQRVCPLCNVSIDTFSTHVQH